MDFDWKRLRLGFWVVLVGLGVVLAVTLVAISQWKTASDVAAVVGSVTSVVGTIVGAYLGMQFGSAGRERAEAQREDAQQKAIQLAAVAQPEAAARILGISVPHEQPRPEARTD